MKLFPIIAILFLVVGSSHLLAAPPIELGEITASKARVGLIGAAEAYLGAPYRFGGIDSRGFDCSGLVYRSFMDSLKVAVPRSSNLLHTWADKISPDQMRPGDLVFFITSGPGISHVGIYVGDRQFIHAPSRGFATGVMYSCLDEAYWRKTFAGAGRALPWDEEAELAIMTNANAESEPGSQNTDNESPVDEKFDL